jgi:hypothetical protein
MSAAIRELKEAENTLSKTWEGFLSQQGGDCPVSFIITSHLLSRETNNKLVLATKIFQVGWAKVDRVS